MSYLTFNVDDQIINAPVAFSDIENANLANDYAASGARLQKGFFFKGATAGSYSCITLAKFWQYARALDKAGTITLVDPIPNTLRNTILQAIVAAGDRVNVYLAAYQWVDCPVVFLESDNIASTTINIGLY